MKCRIINIGDELLLGQVVNTNAATMAQMLAGIGIEVVSIEVIPDDRKAILDALHMRQHPADIIILSGGLGPTRDDVTKHALAEFFGTELVFDQAAFDHLSKILRSYGKEVINAHRDQCFLPASARKLENALGTAPGLYFNKNTSHYYIVPGVPFEMEYLMEKLILPELETMLNGETERIYRTLCTAGKGESEIASRLEELENSLPAFMKLAYLPKPASVRIRLFGELRTKDDREAFEATWSSMQELLGSSVYATKDISLSEAIGEVLMARKQTVSVAESCTGGYLGHLFTSISGSSAYFQGGAIVYSNELKMSILNVPAEILDNYGAVSRETVEHMVQGAIGQFGTDYAIAVSGIAGPTGGTAEKPVGTVWICAGSTDFVESRKLQLTKDRLRNIELSAMAGLNLLRKFLKAHG